ncbi:MAG: dihydrofolate reductase family protein [Myxococcota bacterium]
MSNETAHAGEAGRVCVYMACSLDGFIAGPDHDIAWLTADYSGPDALPAEPGALDFEPFMAQVGALLMGRGTYDVIEPMDAWGYGETPVLVATRRALNPKRETVRAVSGSIEEVVAEAKTVAGDKIVYLDGGDLVRQALDAGLVHEMTITFVPVLLGGGVRLFDGLVARRRLRFSGHHALGGGLVQLRAQVLAADAT